MQALQTKQTLVTPFFHNQIKRRIAMITNSQKTSHRYLRKLLALPLTILVVLLLAFTYKNKNIEQQNLSAESKNISIASVSDTTSKDVHEAIALLGAVMDKKPGEPIKFKGVTDTTQLPLIIVDNVKVKDQATLQKMDANTIQSMNVFKGDQAIERFGKEGENGVINIITKNSGISAPTSMGGTIEMRKNDINNPNEKIVTGYQIKINPSENVSDKLLIQKDQGFIVKGRSTFDTNQQPLIVVNGVKMTKGYNLNNVNPVNIESVTVLKDKSATSQYGIDGADGAILITTRDKTPLKITNIPIDSSSSNKLNEVVVTGYGIRSDDNNKLFEQVEQPATFPGGDAEWRKFLERQLNANVGIENKAPAGTYYAIVQFVVHENGAISDIKALTNNGYGIEEEAVRVISKGPKWEPAVQNGNKVSSIKKQRITFIVNDDGKPNNPELKEVVVVGYGTKASSTPPSFKGGQSEWIKYLEKNVNPNIPVDNGSPAGTYKTQIQFLVNADGTATEFKSLTNLGFGMEEEALRVIQSVKLWEPAKYNGKNIDAYKIQPITFTIQSEDNETDNKKPSVDNLSAIYPNPATSKVQLQFDAATTGKGNIIVTDMNGAVKMTSQVGLTKGKNNVFVNVSGLAQGTYIISLKGVGADKTAVYKMVKQ